jgi:acyl-CoA synthetase (AMP-forming)/AMP-acid ligase II
LITQFFDRMTSYGDAEAIVDNGRSTSYGELLSLVDQWRGRLDDVGIAPGHVVALEGGHSARTTAALLALAERRAICVPMTSLPDDKRAEFVDVASAEAVVQLDRDGGKAHVVDTGRRATHPLYERLRAERRPGLVLFSSGTTGRSKASVLDLDKMLARYAARRGAQRILSFMYPDHIGGINTLLHTLSQGGALVTTADRTPERVFETIERHAVDVLPTTPTFLTMALISGAYRNYDLSSLRLITYGTEPMPEQTLTRLRAALPDVRLKQTYGLSELGILATKSRADDSLWVRLGGDDFEYKIIDDILWIRSDIAMLGYLNAPAPFDGEGYFNTQDAVEVDGDYVRILGRVSDLINVGGEKVYPNEVESVLLEIPNVAEATVFGRRSPVTGMIVAATIRPVLPEDARLLRRRALEHCRRRLEPFKVPAVVQVSGDEQYGHRFKKLRSAS